MRLAILLAASLFQASPEPQRLQPSANQQRDTTTHYQVMPETTLVRRGVSETKQQQQTSNRGWYSDVKPTDILLTLFTLGLVIVGYFQWQALKDTVREASKASEKQSADMQGSIAVAHDTAKAAISNADAARASVAAYREAERAWVSFVKVDSIGFNSATDLATGKKDQAGTIFDFKWTNGGRTPAIECSLYSDMKVLEPPYGSELPRFTPGDSSVAAKMVLVPGVIVSSPQIPVLKPDMDRLSKRQCRVLLYGRGDYKDVFSPDEPRHFEVCLEVEYGGVRGDGATIFSFRVTGPQNSAR